MQMMLVHRRQAGQNHGSAGKGPRVLGIAEQDFRRKRMTLDREFQPPREFLPSEVPGFREGAHLARTLWKRPLAGKKSTIEEFCVAVEGSRFELRHIDMMLADERLDFARAEGRVLIGGDKPVPCRRGAKPLRERFVWTALVRRRAVVHELWDHAPCSALEHHQGQWFAHARISLKDQRPGTEQVPAPTLVRRNGLR